MTIEEQEIFFNKIKETILPLAINMQDEQIKKIIQTVEETNENLPTGFSAFLFEQIIIHKYIRTIK